MDHQKCEWVLLEIVKSNKWDNMVVSNRKFILIHLVHKFIGIHLNSCQICLWNYVQLNNIAEIFLKRGETVDANVALYWGFPLRDFPLTHCRKPIFQIEGILVDLIDGARTEQRISTPGDRSKIGTGFVKIL